MNDLDRHLLINGYELLIHRDPHQSDFICTVGDNSFRSPCLASLWQVVLTAFTVYEVIEVALFEHAQAVIEGGNRFHYVVFASSDSNVARQIKIFHPGGSEMSVFLASQESPWMKHVELSWYIQVI